MTWAIRLITLSILCCISAMMLGCGEPVEVEENWPPFLELGYMSWPQFERELSNTDNANAIVTVDSKLIISCEQTGLFRTPLYMLGGEDSGIWSSPSIKYTFEMNNRSLRINRVLIATDMPTNKATYRGLEEGGAKYGPRSKTVIEYELYVSAVGRAKTEYKAYALVRSRILRYLDDRDIDQYVSGKDDGVYYSNPSWFKPYDIKISNPDREKTIQGLDRRVAEIAHWRTTYIQLPDDAALFLREVFNLRLSDELDEDSSSDESTFLIHKGICELAPDSWDWEPQKESENK